jgi:hypothetical protein
MYLYTVHVHTIHTKCTYMCTYQGNLGRTLLASILFRTLLGGALDEKRGSIQFRLRVHSLTVINTYDPPTQANTHARTNTHTHSYTLSRARSAALLTHAPEARTHASLSCPNPFAPPYPTGASSRLPGPLYSTAMRERTKAPCSWQ